MYVNEEFEEIDKKHIGDLEFLGEFIAFCRTEKGLSQRQVALYAGISNSELHRIEKGQRQKPSPKILKKISEIVDVQYEILLQYAGYLDLQDESNIKSNLSYKNLSDDEKNFILNYICTKWNSESPDGKQYTLEEIERVLFDTDKKEKNSSVVLVYGTIPAGIPMECIEDIIDKEEIDADMLRGGKEYFGLKIKGNSMYPEYLDNDTIILEKVDDVESGTDAVVMVNGNDGTFKRVFKNETGIILQPLNSAFQPMIYTNEQIASLPVRVIGKVVELRRKK